MTSDDLRLRLLSLDGGGVRGLSTLYMLQDLMKRIGGPDKPAPKPCEWFDMIGGTSTGGLIAIMLGRLQMSVEECIKAYITLSTDVFSTPRRPRIFHHPLAMLAYLSNRSIGAKFDSAELERIIKELITDAGMEEGELLKTTDTHCRVFVSAVSDSTSEAVCLKSYHTNGSDDLIDHTKIWEACRATSAAKTFFDPVEIGPNKERFSDGGLRNNNPVHQVWDQARQVWQLSENDLCRSVGCFVSIGTGLPKFPEAGSRLAEIFKLLQKVVTDTERTAEEFVRGKTDLRQAGRYFRFNIPRGLEGIGLDEAAELSRIAGATRAYIQAEETSVKAQACADALAGRLAGRALVTRVFNIRNIPFTADKFVSRPSEMEKIRRQLLPKPQPAVDRRRIFVLSGMGGIGKTQLAAEFCRQHKHDFTSIYWLEGNTEADVRKSFVKFASIIPEDQILHRGQPTTKAEEELIVQDVLVWLAQEHNRKWLLVFDNVDLDDTQSSELEEGAYSISKYMPADHGAILITTRRLELENYSTGTTLKLVDEDMCRRIFKSWYGTYEKFGEVADLLESRSKNSESARLLDSLGGLPIAIAQAAHYIKVRRVSIAEYVELRENEWAHVSGVLTSRTRLSDYHTPMGLTWSISLKRIRRDGLYGTYAYELVKLWAFLDNKDIWYNLLSGVKRQPREWADNDPEGLSIEEWKRRYEWPELPPWLRAMSQERVAFLEAVGLLQDNCLIERQASSTTSNFQASAETASYSMHSVVHACAMQMQVSDTDDDRMASLIIALSLFDLETPGMNTWGYTVLQRWTPHADKCFQWASGSRDAKLRAASLSSVRSICGLLKIGALYYVQGLFKKTETVIDFAKEALDDRQSQGKLAPWTVHWRCAYTSGAARLYQRNFPAAEAELVEALGVAKQAVGERDVQRVMESRKQLCTLYCHQGNLQKGIDSLLAMTADLEAFPSSETDDHHKRMAADVALLLGMAHMRNDSIELAEVQLNKAYDNFDSLTTPVLGSKLVVMIELGRLYLEKGRYPSAEKVLRKTLEGSIQYRGVRHWNTILSALRLSTALIRQGQFDEAQLQLGKIPEQIDAQAKVRVFIGRRELATEMEEQGEPVGVITTAYQAAWRMAHGLLLASNRSEILQKDLDEMLEVYKALRRVQERQGQHDLVEELDRQLATCNLGSDAKL